MYSITKETIRHAAALALKKATKYDGSLAVVRAIKPGIRGFAEVAKIKRNFVT